MLSKILPITNTKLQILSSLYKYNELNLAELSKSISITPQNTLKSIERLNQILDIRKLGSIKLYSINNNYFEIFEPIIETFRLEQSLDIHINLLNKIKNINRIQKVFLFGSFAKNTQNKNSDLDLIIVTDTVDIVKKELKTLQKIAPFVIEPLYLSIEEFENELENKNSRFRKILEDKSLRIKVK